MNKKNKVEIYDTTLRDGTQQTGINLSLEEKLLITKKLDDLGVDFIEGGFAGSNPKDEEYFKRVKGLNLQNSKVVSFGQTRKANNDTKNDVFIKALLSAETDFVTIVGKSSAYQVEKIIKTSLEENINMISDSIRFLKEKNKEVFFDAEHFFDGYKENPDYSLMCLKTAYNAGAKRIILCDTNGGTLPNEIGNITKIIVNEFNDESIIGIHTHNDTDTAVASTLAAVDSGAFQVQGCINGYGERTGNANLISVIANLNLKMGKNTLSDNKNIKHLTDLSHYVSEVANKRPFPFQPFVGKNAFTHKGGMHAAGYLIDPNSFQHIEPNQVGNESSISISELSGKKSVLTRIENLGLGNIISTDEAEKITQTIKIKESKGYAFELADASLDLLIYRSLPNYEQKFELIDFMVIVENKRRSSMGTGWRNDGSEHPILSEATIKIKTNDHIMHTAAEGNGPVGALDNAMRKALIDSFPEINKVRLTDFVVRVVEGSTGTEAVVRVLIESSDDKEVWTSVGASSNIIEASWLALSDSMEWFLIKNSL
ncbi:MAG: citramalate synthase [Dehalococcoidales bacterium]|jgi:2-isopropylmalate synthase|nr:citramalate synthase [Dehalococcoidia bacterium]NCG35102.1 citramalate synthase [Dehalococcoidales bacterium]